MWMTFRESIHSKVQLKKGIGQGRRSASSVVERNPPTIYFSDALLPVFCGFLLKNR
jgi:hypothetical protein